MEETQNRAEKESVAHQSCMFDRETADRAETTDTPNETDVKSEGTTAEISINHLTVHVITLLSLICESVSV